MWPLTTNKLSNFNRNKTVTCDLCTLQVPKGILCLHTFFWLLLIEDQQYNCGNAVVSFSWKWQHNYLYEVGLQSTV